MWLGIAAILVLVWLVSAIVMHISSFLIHVLLFAALVSVVLHFIRKRT